MPIPLIVLGVAAAGAWAALRNPDTAISGDVVGDDTGPAQDVIANTSEDTVSSSTVDPAGLSARTLSWQSELIAQAPDLDINVMLRWVQRESDGNPASVGSIAQLRRDGWAREAGIGQVYFESRAQTQFGVTSDELRAGAVPDAQTLMREQTDAERMAQTGSLIAMLRRYIADGNSVLSQTGQSWDESDVYCLAKLRHALPVLAGQVLLHAASADSWDSYRAWLESMTTVEQCVAVYSGATPYVTVKNKDGTVSFVGWTRYLKNAQYTGRGG